MKKGMSHSLCTEPTSPSTASPSTAGPSTTSPSTTSPSTTGPSIASPSTASPSTAGLSTAKPLPLRSGFLCVEIPSKPRYLCIAPDVPAAMPTFASHKRKQAVPSLVLRKRKQAMPSLVLHKPKKLPVILALAPHKSKELPIVLAFMPLQHKKPHRPAWLKLPNDIVLPRDLQVVNLFRLFFPHQILKTIIANTNQYAESKRAGEKSQRWSDLTIPELLTFLGICIYSGLFLKSAGGLPWLWNICDTCRPLHRITEFMPLIRF
ncbi:hypothetical protein BC936DRAFT_145689 [Jimgerdemannia flammicorona]|uniref:PiggyBac transposable element-derived protein domain-containing protein n=1 Tax=Jimgerdemannia flammicorona TaxID=994334 RepID=A0A433D9A9_9FUNG|nr:hypothetical protein BC936DRAFT_145689 [Jimgerdemannia flammicorona]